MLDHLIGLSEEQLSVVKDKSGLRFIVACPGGGKTRVLVSAVAELIQDGIHPTSILAFTFTKAAAEEMISRLREMVGATKASLLNVGTMHSIFFRVLREQVNLLGRSSIRVLDERRAENKQMLRRILKTLNISEEAFPVPDQIKNIGRLKNEGLKPQDDEALDFLVQEKGLPPTVAQTTLQIFEAYELAKFEEGVIDFDDMLTLTLDLFRAYPKVTRRYAESWKYVFVDETHDINPVQNALIQLLVSVHHNLFAVFDPNQSIYRFRGAHPDIVLNHATHFPGAKLKKLTQNFRSGQSIVDRCYKLIHHNPDPLEITATSKKEGGLVEWWGCFDSTDQEAIRVGQFIEERIHAGQRPRDFFILFRTNAQSRAPEEQMASRALPYRLLGLSSFYSRREIRDILAYLEFAAHPEPLSDAFERIYNRPNKFLGKAWYAEFCSQIDASHSWEQVLLNGRWSKGFMKRGAMELRGQLKDIIAFYNRKLLDPAITLGDVARRVVGVVGYEDWCRKEDEDNLDRLENLQEFISTIDRFDDTDKLLAYISAVTDSLRKSEKTEDKVTLSTIHKAKGLEAKIVFILGMSDGLLPHFLGDLEEERRLAFVAISRGEEEVYLSTPTNYRNNLLEPSRFLLELGLIEPQPEELEDARSNGSAGVLSEDSVLYS